MSLGATTFGLTAAVRGGHLVRARRDHYVLPGTDHHLVEAVRIGGRLACVSALSSMGIFAFDASRTHVHMDHSMSRSRSPKDRFIPLTPFNRHGVQLHWHPLIDDNATEFSVGIIDALAQSLRCQEPGHALASIDNALHLGRIEEGDLSAIFAKAPERVCHLRELVDGSAESGQETMLRLIIGSTGHSCESQVSFEGIGRVDFVVAGCLVVEADSRTAHDGWEKHVSDRGRDLALARLGYMTLRPAYQHTMQRPELVAGAIAKLVSDRQRA
ncbi:MAG TPA: hypothetical protein VHZ81_08020 [Galbitalea sp.]|jgi:hypothetical protein|nr:hypothetical protein [Galbitalea sp.]